MASIKTPKIVSWYQTNEDIRLSSMKKICFLIPFNLNRLTGTPIRGKTVIRSTMTFADVSVVTTREYTEVTNVSKIDKATALPFTRLAWKHLRANKPDIIHCISPLGLAAALPYALMTFGKTKVVFEAHGLMWYEHAKSSLPKRLVWTILDIFGLLFATRVIAMSHSQKKLMSPFANKKVSVLWGPVDLGVEYIPPQPHEGVIVGYLGNHSWWQGLPALIEAARILADHPDIHFKIGGFDASDVSVFPKLPNITYHGRAERNGVLNFLRGCDVLMSVRIQDAVSSTQYPQKLSEYLTAGRPVIASDVSDQRIVVEAADCGIVINETVTPERIASAIRTVTAIDAETRAHTGYRAFSFAQDNFFMEPFRKKLQGVYDSLYA